MGSCGMGTPSAGGLHGPSSVPGDSPRAPGPNGGSGPAARTGDRDPGGPARAMVCPAAPSKEPPVDRSPAPATAVTASRPGRSRTILAAIAVLLGLGAVAAPASAETASPRIVGGKQATITQRPFQVALYDPAPNGQPTSPYLGQFCGGAIVDATHVVTAGHCVFSGQNGQARPVSSVRVLAGTARLRDGAEPEAPTARDVAVTQMVVRPGFTLSNLDGDAAVLTLAEPLYTGSPQIDGTTSIAP
ncbi:MAG: trypsin-like serine protease, partial [Actinobacteria bacterium]|nr:trypsin-like serine protease [Actinomycetota bacterium]